MEKLISRAAVEDLIMEADPFWCEGMTRAIFEGVKRLQPIDAVPVVRCKDCKYRPIDTGGHNYGQDLLFPDDYKCPCRCEDQWYSWMPRDDWFCADGERKEE